MLNQLPPVNQPNILPNGAANILALQAAAKQGQHVPGGIGQAMPAMPIAGMNMQNNLMGTNPLSPNPMAAALQHGS
jgi:hypothetical protein